MRRAHGANRADDQFEQGFWCLRGSNSGNKRVGPNDIRAEPNLRRQYSASAAIRLRRSEESETSTNGQTPASAASSEHGIHQRCSRAICLRATEYAQSNHLDCAQKLDRNAADQELLDRARNLSAVD